MELVDVLGAKARWHAPKEKQRMASKGVQLASVTGPAGCNSREAGPGEDELRRLKVDLSRVG